MARTFQLTEDAIRDLEQSMDYLSQHSISAAMQLADNLERTFHFLAEWPNTGKKNQEHLDHVVRLWTIGEHSIAYLSETQPLIIVAVIHSARDISTEIMFRLGKL